MKLSSVGLLKHTLDSRAIRGILSLLSGRCERDGESRLEVALELLTGAREEACWVCRHLAKPAVEWAVKAGSKAFGSEFSEVVEAFKEPYWRRGLVSVLKGIARFGVRKPFTPGAPFLVVWNYTYACNLKCKHCYASAGLAGRRELSTEEAKRVVRDLADIGVVAVAFSGGEPLLRRDFYEIAKLAHEHGMYTAVATNGTVVTREVAEKLREAGVGYVQVSLDGARAETHDSFRGVRGAFEKAIAGIRNLVEAGVFTEVATTVTKLNYREVMEIIELCEELGVDWWMMYNFVPTGRGREITKLDLSPAEREELLRMLWLKLREGSGVQVLSTAPQFARVALQAEGEGDEVVVPGHFYNPKLRGRLIELSSFIGGCGAGRLYCAIDADGSIYPCVFLPLRVGSVRESSLGEVWACSDVFWDLRDREKLKGACGSCRFKYVCGGCRARAYGYFRDYLAPDPGCIYSGVRQGRLEGMLYLEHHVKATA